MQVVYHVQRVHGGNGVYIQLSKFLHNILRRRSAKECHLLVGIVVWGVFGKLDTILMVGAVTDGEQTICYVKESDISSISADMKVRLNDEEFGIADIAVQPIQVDAAFPEYLAHLGGISQGEWAYAVILDGSFGADGGIYAAEIVIESIAPMTFVIN